MSLYWIFYKRPILFGFWIVEQKNRLYETLMYVLNIWILLFGLIIRLRFFNLFCFLYNYDFLRIQWTRGFLLWCVMKIIFGKITQNNKKTFYFLHKLLKARHSLVLQRNENYNFIFYYIISIIRIVFSRYNLALNDVRA